MLIVAVLMHGKPGSVMMPSDIRGSEDSHKRNTVVSQCQKGVGCVIGWKRDGLWVHLVYLGSFVYPVFVLERG